jgi:uncharacterized membrane protein
LSRGVGSSTVGKSIGILVVLVVVQDLVTGHVDYGHEILNDHENHEES